MPGELHGCTSPNRIGSAAQIWGEGVGRVETLASSSSAWWQLWLQLTPFAVVPVCSPQFEGAGQCGYGTAANRPERDHDGLAVWSGRTPVHSSRCSIRPARHSRPPPLRRAAMAVEATQDPVIRADRKQLRIRNRTGGAGSRSLDSCRSAHAAAHGRRVLGGSAEPQCDGVVVDNGMSAHVTERVVDGLWRGLRPPFLLAGLRGDRH
jgi:hypothetical protein